MTKSELIARHSTAIKRIGHSRLLALPDGVKKRLINAPSFEGKVILMEGIANRYSAKMTKMMVKPEWEVDDEDELSFLPETVPVYENIPEEDIADYISDRYGYLVKGFIIEPQ